MIYVLQIKIFSGDEFENSTTYLDPIYSKDLPRLEYIQSKLLDKFKDSRSFSLKVNINPISAKTEITRKDIDNLFKQINIHL